MKELEILKDISKGAKMGINGIELCLEKVQDSRFKTVLYDQKDEYENIYARSKNLLLQNGIELNESDIIEKAMSWMSIQFSTLTDNSNSKLAEILIQGNDMGIVKGQKLLNNNNFKDIPTQNILKDFVDLQEKNIETLKFYL